MRILIVEDDPSTGRSLELMLSHSGMNPYLTDLGEDAIDLMTLYEYDAVVLETNLPDISGIEVIRQLRTRNVSSPIIVLSRDDDTNTKLKAFGAGCDDYVTKPFHREELIARINAVVRRSQGHSNSVIDTGRMRVDLDAKAVTVDGNAVHLTGKEYLILELLSLRKGRILTKEMFLNHLYGGMDEPELKIIDVFVMKIRKKLSEATGGSNYIETVWGRGYRISEESNEATQ